MRLMLWAMDLHHRKAEFLTVPDYFSRLGADMIFDPLTRVYLDKTAEFCRLYAPISGPMRPENMPGYRRPRFRSGTQAKNPVLNANVDESFAPILASIAIGMSGVVNTVSKSCLF